MANRRDEWVEMFQALGEAFFAVLKSEWEVLAESWWKDTARRVLLASIWFLAAGVFLFYLSGLLVASAVLILDIWWKPWQAALLVSASVLALLVALAAVGYFGYLRHFKNPAATLRHRLADHLEWWHERLIEGERILPKGDDHDDEPSRAP